ncbi:MAG TPA: DUF1993 domain-containing protein [Variovorax sp.]
MAISFYDLSVPVFTRGLGQLAHVLDKALAHAVSAGIDPTEFVNARLAPDMFTLAGQVQSASDAAKLGAARLAGITAPSFPDTETTYAELQARVHKTIEFLNSIDRALIEGQEAREITLKLRGTELKVPALRMLLQFTTPNFYFHLTTAYDVLRHKGVPVGKIDFLGAF